MAVRRNTWGFIRFVGWIQLAQETAFMNTEINEVRGKEFLEDLSYYQLLNKVMDVGFQVFTAVIMKSTILWDITDYTASYFRRLYSSRPWCIESVQ
jgi:hypothetical protein